MLAEFRTPRRKHSSLFQRMQEEIQKISKKLSAAKTSARAFSQTNYQNQKRYNFSSKSPKSRQKFQKSYLKQKSKQKQRQKLRLRLFGTQIKEERKNIHFDRRKQPSNVQTVRVKHFPQREMSFSQFSDNKTLQSKTLKRYPNLASYRKGEERQIQNLRRQNEQLTCNLKQLQLVCQDQSYRLGFTAELHKEKLQKEEEEKQKLKKEIIYLKKLCQHYKTKSQTYKKKLSTFLEHSCNSSELQT